MCPIWLQWNFQMKFSFRKVVKLDVTKWSLEYQLSTISTKSEEPFQTEKKTLAYLIIDTWEDISFIWSIILTWSTFSHFFFIYFFVCLYWLCYDGPISSPELWGHNIVTDIELISFGEWYQQGRSYFTLNTLIKFTARLF